VSVVGKSSALFAVFCGLVVCLESAIPYVLAEAARGTGNVFLGQLQYTTDQNMYFSFIRQAYDGHVLFNNKLTHIPNNRVFLNLEFLSVGLLWRLTGVSENVVYQIWRVLGTAVLAGAFALCARVVLPSVPRRRTALVLFLFSGGFGAMFVLLRGAGMIGPETYRAGTLDLWAGVNPFEQIVTNPHFSLSHGLVLLGLACFILGERRDRAHGYAMSGVCLLLIGVIRPYDLISVTGVIVLYGVVESMIEGFEWSRTIRRCVPLIMAGPAYGYNLWLFGIDPMFNQWFLQGHNIDFFPSPLWHYAAYGIVGVLAVGRVSLARTQPMQRDERFLIVWFVTMFLLCHIGRVVPFLGFSPQMVVPSFGPLVLLACAIRGPDVLPGRIGIPAGLSVVLAFVAVSNAAILWYYAGPFLRGADPPRVYASADEREAWRWLDGHVADAEVALALPAEGGRIAKYTRARVVIGHYGVTPNYARTLAVVEGFYGGQHSDWERGRILDELGARYVYVGPGQGRESDSFLQNTDGITPAFKNDTVVVYRVLIGRRR